MFDEENKTPGGRPHAKRLGRELAMQYLFRCDMRGELPDAAGFDLFFDEVREEHGLHENRFARKGREYAVELYTTVAVHRDEIDDPEALGALGLGPSFAGRSQHHADCGCGDALF